MKNNSVLRARGIGKTVKSGTSDLVILREIDLEVTQGEAVAVVGASGSGKSTLLAILAGLDAPSAGAVELEGVSLTSLDEDARARLRAMNVGFVFQSFQLLPALTALENVMLPGRIAGLEPAHIHESAAALLVEVGLEDRLDHFPNQLSGGERQRVALCRALVLEPPLLLADEPTGNLDPESGEQVFQLLLALQARHGTTGILVTHNPEIAARCTRILRLDDGVVRE